MNITENKVETKNTIRSVDNKYELIKFFDVTFKKVNGNWIIIKYNKTGEDYEK